jgi:hypothetical protein
MMAKQMLRVSLIEARERMYPSVKVRRIICTARIWNDAMKLLIHANIRKGSSEIPPPAKVSENEPCGTGRGLALIRLVAGGGICGGFLGIFCGALLGTLYGVWISDLSVGLDGALIGSAVLAVLGAGYGLFCGAREGSEASFCPPDGETSPDILDD